MSTEVDVSRFREHRTRGELNSLLRHGHIIPVSKGLTSAYVEAHYPRWTWNALMSIFRAADIVLPSAYGGPPKCDDRVVAFHFSSPMEFYVEWAGGVEPIDVAMKRRTNDLTAGQWMFDEGGDKFVATTGGLEPDWVVEGE